MPGRISGSRPAVARGFGRRCCSRPSGSGNRPAEAKADGSGPELASERPEPDRGGLAPLPARQAKAGFGLLEPATEDRSLLRSEHRQADPEELAPEARPSG